MLSGKRELKQVEVTKEFKDDAFPTRLPEWNVILLATVGGTEICYLCMDMPPGGICMLHLYIVPEHKSLENVMVLKEMFYSHLHPWCADKDKVMITVHCAGDDEKTTELFRTFDFEPDNINMAIMPIRSKGE